MMTRKAAKTTYFLFRMQVRNRIHMLLFRIRICKCWSWSMHHLIGTKMPCRFLSIMKTKWMNLTKYTHAWI